MKIREIKFDKDFNKTYIFWEIKGYEDFDFIISQDTKYFTYGWKKIISNKHYGSYHSTMYIDINKLIEIEKELIMDIEEFKKLNIR